MDCQPSARSAGQHPAARSRAPGVGPNDRSEGAAIVNGITIIPPIVSFQLSLYLREIQVLKKETLAITHTNGAINTDIPSKGASGPPAAKAEHYTIIILYS